MSARGYVFNKFDSEDYDDIPTSPIMIKTDIFGSLVTTGNLTLFICLYSNVHFSIVYWVWFIYRILCKFMCVFPLVMSGKIFWFFLKFYLKLVDYALLFSILVKKSVPNELFECISSAYWLIVLDTASELFLKWFLFTFKFNHSRGFIFDF